jgi:hypothetical protein
MFYIKRLFNSFTNYFYKTSDIQNSIENNELELSRNKTPIEYSNNDISEVLKILTDRINDNEKTNKDQVSSGDQHLDIVNRDNDKITSIENVSNISTDVSNVVNDIIHVANDVKDIIEEVEKIKSDIQNDDVSSIINDTVKLINSIETSVDDVKKVYNDTIDLTLNQDDNSETEPLNITENTKSVDDDYKTLFDMVAEKDLQNGFDFSNFKDIPDTFMNIPTKTFGNSINNPFLQLYKSALDKTNSFEDRCQAVRYMQRIFYLNNLKYCTDVAINILKDESQPFSKRYYFFSNNDAYVKLDYEIVNECHKYVYNHFYEFNAPLMYKILSAQFILAHLLHTEYDRDELQQFLLEIANDKEQSVNYRAECADILYRHGVEKHYVEDAENVIKELGELYQKNKVSTIYTNAQNVHDITINKKIINTLQKLIETVKTTRNSGEVLESIRNEHSYLDSEKLHKIMSSLERITIDTAKYEMLNMSDILVLVWEYICNSEHKNELENRLLQELEEMDETCSTGHLSRILNVLSGYFVESSVEISFKEQLRSNIFARYTKMINMLPEYKKEKINEEMILTNPSEKDTIKEFLCDYNIEETLYKEFVNSGHIDVCDFYETYEKAIDDFFGKLY